jgi:hypothetical protein
MADSGRIVIFAEDKGHEEFLRPVIERCAQEISLEVDVRVQSARGGHGRALDELKLFQKLVLESMSGFPLPDMVVIGVDSNCRQLNDARREIRAALDPRLGDRTIIACPDPHVEIWYLSDPKAFAEAVGTSPKVGKRKCEKDRYKQILAKAVADAGHPAPLGGIEFGREIVTRLDWRRAGASVTSLGMFLKELRAGLNRIKGD